MNAAASVNALFHKPELAISDPDGFEKVRSAISERFAGGQVQRFLAQISGQKARIRDFETVLGKGLLGADTPAAYASLDNGDQGQIREFYLASLEQVVPELRQKFFKLYSYY